MWMSAVNGQVYADLTKVDYLYTYDNGDGTWSIRASFASGELPLDTGVEYLSKQDALDAIAAHIGSENIADTF